MTPLSDASPLEQMSDQEIAQELGRIPIRADREHHRDVLREAARRLRATDLAEQLQMSKIGHDSTFRTLNDVKRELAHYKAGEQPRVEDRDREIAALKHQIKAIERPATPAGTGSVDLPHVSMPPKVVWFKGMEFVNASPQVITIEPEGNRITIRASPEEER